MWAAASPAWKPPWGSPARGAGSIWSKKSNRLGGNARRLRATWKGEALKPYLADLAIQVETHERIAVYTNTQVAATTGSLGNFTTRLHSEDGRRHHIEHGVTVLATGGKEARPEGFLYGKHPNVMTHLDLDEALEAKDARLPKAKSAVFIQCVGSRNDARPYCSKICCTHSLKSALSLKELNPNMRVYILYRDIRAYGFREKLYKEARGKGIVFIRYESQAPPSVAMSSEETLLLTIRDHVLGKPVRIKPDLLVLAAAIVPERQPPISVRDVSRCR